MLPTLDSAQQSFARWQQSAWPKKSLQAGVALVPVVLAWPAVVGAGYAIVVRSRLQSAGARNSLVALMVISCLVAKGAWWQLVYAGASSVIAARATEEDMVEQSPRQSQGIVAGTQSQQDNSNMLATVTKVVSGSFLEVSIDGHAYQVQLIGIKAPMPGTHETPPECYGDESKRYLQGLIGNGRVQLTTDGQLADRDEFGIMQRYAVGLDGSLLNRQMIDAGMVEESGRQGYDQKVAFMGAQEAAKAAERGLWSKCKGDKPTPTPTQSVTQAPTPTPTQVVDHKSNSPKHVNPVAPTPKPTKSANQGLDSIDTLPIIQQGSSSGNLP